MKQFTIAIVAIAIVLIGVVALRSGDDTTNNSVTTASASQTTPPPVTPQFQQVTSTPVTIPEGKQIVTLAGGCFWCVEAVFQETAGVDDVISGFAGGTESDPGYDAVVRGYTSHREAIQFTYDPAIITYSDLLDIYWRAIDPTDGGGQFVDRGYVYTTAIYYHDESQQATAQASIDELLVDRGYDQIATELLPFTTFFPAEEYHQDYYKKSSDNYKHYESGSGREEYRQSLLQ